MFHLPPWFQKASVGFVFFIELIVPFLVFAPRRARMTGAALIASLQVLILLTGNYAFFNWLALALCLFLLDDQFLRRWFAPPSRAAVANRWVTASLLVCLVPLGALQIAGLWWPWVSPALGASLRIVNPYGLFAMMTSSRPEIVIEGSNDGATWSEYEFRYKPGDIRRRPPWVAPHQPRLDWQMWFAALGPREESPWLRNLMVRLLQGSPEVLRLLAHNPFPGRPPRHVRAVLYEYHFTSRAERAGTGNWWRRETEGLYFPPSSLSVDARVRRFEEPVSAAVRASPPRPVHRGVGLKTPDPECSSRAGPKPPSFRESLRSAARHWATGP
jgi:hypothetical protein